MDQGDFFDIIMPLTDNVPGLLDHIMQSVVNPQPGDNQPLDVGDMPDLVDSDLEDDIAMPPLEPIPLNNTLSPQDNTGYSTNGDSYGGMPDLQSLSGSSNSDYEMERNQRGDPSTTTAHIPLLLQPDGSPNRRRARVEDVEDQEDVSQPPRNRQRVQGPVPDQPPNVIPLFNIEALSGDAGNALRNAGGTDPQARPRSQSNPATPSLPMHNEQAASQTGTGHEQLPRLPQPGGLGFIVTFDANGMPRVSQPIFGPPGIGPDMTDNMDAEDRAAMTGFGAMLANLFQPPQPEKDDPVRARRLVEALEDVPEGLVQRMEQIAKASNDEAAGCAICWDSLRNEEGAGFSTADADASTPKEEGPVAGQKPLPRIVSLPCSHVFHSSCLLPWFARPKHTTCPTCRFNLDPDNLTRTRPTAANTAGPAPVDTPPVQAANTEHPVAPVISAAHDTPPAVTPQSDNLTNGQAQPPMPPQLGPTLRPSRRSNGHTFNFTYTVEISEPTFGDNNSEAGQGGPEPAVPTGLNNEHAPDEPASDDASQPRFTHNLPPELGAGMVAHIRHAIERNLPTFLNLASRFPILPATEENTSTVPVTEPPLSSDIANGAEPSQATADAAPEAESVTHSGPAEHSAPPAAPQTPTAPVVPPMSEPPAIPADTPDHAVPPPLPAALPRFADFFAPPANLRPGMIPGPLPTEVPPPFPHPFGRFMYRGRNGQNRGPRREWTLPDAPGPSIRQRVEKRERELGLRCSDASCGVGPSDEDPIPSPSAVDTKQVVIRGFHAPGDSSKHACDHRFHPSCLVSAERVAGWNGEKREEDQIPVACPACRCHGYVEQVDWESGVQALAAAA